MYVYAYLGAVGLYIGLVALSSLSLSFSFTALFLLHFLLAKVWGQVQSGGSRVFCRP